MNKDRFLVVYILWFCDLIYIQPFKIESKYNFVLVKGKTKGKWTEEILFPNTPEEFLDFIGKDKKRKIKVNKMKEFPTKEEFEKFSFNHKSLKKYFFDWENI